MSRGHSKQEKDLAHRMLRIDQDVFQQNRIAEAAFRQWALSVARSQPTETRMQTSDTSCRAFREKER